MPLKLHLSIYFIRIHFILLQYRIHFLRIYEQRINDLQDRCNKADNEIAALKVSLQNVKSDLIKMETLKNEAESRASQAEARAQALSSKGQEETNAALQKINGISAQLQQSFAQVRNFEILLFT